MVQNGTRADIARKRFEDTNQLTAENMIYIGTGDMEDLGPDVEVDKRYIYKTKGKNIISAINDAGIINKAHSAETADQATNANTAKEIVSEDDGNPTIIKGKSDNNQSRVIPVEDGTVDLGAPGCGFGTVYANTFIGTKIGTVNFKGTASAAMNTDFSGETFAGVNLQPNTYLQLSEAGFYYFYLRMPVNSIYHNINFGLVYWEGESKYDSFSAIAGCYKEDKDPELLLDEYCLRITTNGTVVIWEKDNTTNGWKKVENPLARLFYKKIR